MNTKPLSILKRGKKLTAGGFPLYRGRQLNIIKPNLDLELEAGEVTVISIARLGALHEFTEPLVEYAYGILNKDNECVDRMRNGLWVVAGYDDGEIFAVPLREFILMTTGMMVHSSELRLEDM